MQAEQIRTVLILTNKGAKPEAVREEWVKLAVIFNMNSFLIGSKESRAALYRICGVLSHSCDPNCSWHLVS